MANRKLLPGEDSKAINGVKPRKNKKGYWELRVRYCSRIPTRVVLDDGTMATEHRVIEIRKLDQRRERVIEKVDQALKELRTNEEMELNPPEPLPEWHGARTLAEVIDEISLPLVESANLADKSRSTYRSNAKTVRQFLGDMQIDDLWKGARMKERLHQVDEQKSASTRRAVVRFLSRYVYRPLKDHGFYGERPNFDDKEFKPAPPRERYIFTDEEYDSVIDHLFERDTSVPLPDTVEKYMRQSALQRHRSVVALTKLQAGTGIRINEAAGTVWGEIKLHPTSGRVYVHIDASRAKGGKQRDALVVDAKVADWLKRERDQHELQAPVVPSPMYVSQPWNTDNANKAVAVLYSDMAKILDIPALYVERSHIWRHVQNFRTTGILPQELRSALFGHEKETNESSYTAPVTIRRVEQYLDRRDSNPDDQGIQWG